MLLACGAMLATASAAAGTDANAEGFTIAVAYARAHGLAAKELRRLLYAATGALPPILAGVELQLQVLEQILEQPGREGPGAGNQTVFVLGRTDELSGVPHLRESVAAAAVGPDAEAHIVWSVERAGTQSDSASATGPHVIVLGGNSDGAVLHAVYSAAERLLGVRFLLSGDIIPRLPAGHPGLPTARHSLTPRFGVRGLQPFHDFAVGPDFWSLDDFKMVMGQQRKMKLTFIGFHSYPAAVTAAAAGAGAAPQQYTARPASSVSAAGDPLAGQAEPLAWVGKASDLNPNGTVKPSGAYPAFWRTTGDDGWGLTARNTSSYVAGAGRLFPRDCYGSPAQEHVCVPQTPEGQAGVIDAAAALFGAALRFGHALGIKSAIGTQVPLAKPAGLSSQAAFEGMYTRIEARIKPTYYWHWTSERCACLFCVQPLPWTSAQPC
eukprot:SAG22_NODE_48_length_24654_cov_4.406394_27_plen_437_part_00